MSDRNERSARCHFRLCIHAVDLPAKVTCSRRKRATAWMRTAESGNALTFHFCPTCGSTVYWEGEGFPGYVAVAIGNFADPNFPAPTIGGVGGVAPPLGVLAARYAAQAHGEAGVMNETAVFCWVISGD